MIGAGLLKILVTFLKLTYVKFWFAVMADVLVSNNYKIQEKRTRIFFKAETYLCTGLNYNSDRI
jgi:hypothetical protein